MNASGQKSTARMKLSLAHSIGFVAHQLVNWRLTIQAPQFDGAIESRAHYVQTVRIERERRLRMKDGRRDVAVVANERFDQIAIGYGPHFG